MIKDQERAQQILDSLEVAQEACVEFFQAISVGDNTTAKTISDDLQGLLGSLREIGKQLSNESGGTLLHNACDSLLDSLYRATSLIPLNRESALNKIEFELMPILQDAYSQFYFWSCVYPNPLRMKNYYENEKRVLHTNRYIEESEKTGRYKYELTITVLAFNKLEYTKKCVESILETIPHNLNYELILINHGSTDGTKEYFESIKPTKQLDIKVNGILGAIASRIIEGEYVISFSNDVIAGDNAIENMMRCMKDNPDLGFGVPSTPNVSNFQNIYEKYNTTESEMREFCISNNKYDPFRHEKRARLCNPVTFFRSSIWFSAIGADGHYFSNNKANYPDDVLSMLTRRSNYKCILAKDAYCFHFGSITIRDEISKNEETAIYDRGRREFINVFGINPWGIGFCHHPLFDQLISLTSYEKVNILGINSGLGSNPLRIKELYKEKQHNLDAIVYNITDQRSYLEDLRGVSDFVFYTKYVFMLSVSDDFPKEYHHIVIDVLPESDIEALSLICKCVEHLVSGGSAYVNIAGGKEIEKSIEDYFPKAVFSEHWVRIQVD